MQSFKQRYYSIVEFLMRFAASGLFPARWLYKVPGHTHLLPLVKQELHLELVSHCWNYAHLFVYQLESLVQNPPAKLKITFTGFYCREDKDTTALVNEYRNKNVPGIRWNFIALPKEKLLRRAIGRNIAAKASSADWVWFTDCDLAFAPGSLDNLANKLQQQTEILVFPEKIRQTALLKKDNPMLRGAVEEVFNHLEQAEFVERSYSKAAGAFQIVRGEIARDYGYCGQVNCYQQAREHWAKCYEDRAYRWLLGTHGKGLELAGMMLIRHVEKGRYRKGSQISGIRKANRQLRDKLNT